MNTTKVGKVVRMDKFIAIIELEDGTSEFFFQSLKSWNRSLRLGDNCKVFFKYSNMVDGIISYKVIKIA